MLRLSLSEAESPLTSGASTGRTARQLEELVGLPPRTLGCSNGLGNLDDVFHMIFRGQLSA